MPLQTFGDVLSIATTDLRRSDIGLSDASSRANIAYQIVTDEADVALLESCATSSSTSGHHKIQLPANLKETITITRAVLDSNGTVTSNYTLKQISQAEAASRATLPAGKPTDFVFFDNHIELYPSSNSTYEIGIRYRAGAEILTSTNSVPSLSTPWRYPWLIKTKELLSEHIHDFEAKNRYEAEYLRTIARIKNDAARRQLYEGSEPSVSMTGYSNRGRRRAK